MAPRVPCRPEVLMKEGWRLVIKSDGSNVGVEARLLLVRCGDDGEVTPEMMLDANRVRLISVDSKILSTAEQKWLAFEVEAYGMYLGTEEVGWIVDENRATGTRHVAITVMDGFYDIYVKVDRGISASGHRSRECKAEKISIMGREDIICETHEDGNEVDSRFSK